MADVECVMLAAGRSTRMDGWKMTLPWGESTIVEHSLRAALDVCSRVVLVAGFRAEELERIFRDWPRVEVMDNERYEEGMFSSVQGGVRSIGNGSFFLALGDMPGVSGDIYRTQLRWERRLGSIFGGTAHAVIPKYRGKKGHPLLLSPEVKTRILDTGISRTLRDVLAEVPTVIVPVDDHGILHDIDTPADYQSLHGGVQGGSR
jgi:molybdenum cofactor cytidylyltransferase